MQARIIGGIFLLVCLFSTGRAQDVSDTKNSEKLETKDMKLTSDKLKTVEVSDNIKTGSTKNVTPLNLLEQTSKINIDTSNSPRGTSLKNSNSDSSRTSHNLEQTDSSSKSNVDQRSSKPQAKQVKNNSYNLALFPSFASTPDMSSFTNPLNLGKGESSHVLRPRTPLSTQNPHVATFGITEGSLQTRNSGDTNSLIATANKYSSATSSYPYTHKTGFDDIRQELKNNDVKFQDGYDKKMSGTKNSYLYSPVSSMSSNKNSENSRNGYPVFDSPPKSTSLNTAQAYAGVNTVDYLNAYNQGLNPPLFGYPFRSNTNSGNLLDNGMSELPSLGTVTSARSRLIRPHEYIYPQQTPEGVNVVQCTRQNEIHQFWSRTLDCLVCICLNDYGYLQPACVSCSNCQTFTPVQPTPESYVPLPIPDSPIIEPLFPPSSPQPIFIEPTVDWNIEFTTPSPDLEATCSPLPIGQPFTNPLHPCQLCICSENFNIFGKIDVRIDCTENPNCVVPVDVTVLPPMPDIPSPVPLPLCENFPPNVLFSHPTERCKQCKCSLELSEFGVPQPHITCFLDSECFVIPEPTPEPVIPPAPPIPIPVEPYLLPLPPPIVEPVPLPWPPATTAFPPIPPLQPIDGPLPGPPPHESCWPYPPNVQFQHPWDECQVCQCSEFKGVDVINVEINCHTRASCCIVVPEDITPDANSAINAGKPEGYVMPNIQSPYYTGMIDGGQATAEASAQYNPLAPFGYPSQGYLNINPRYQNNPSNVPLTYESASAFSSVANGGSQSVAEASAVTNNLPGNSYSPDNAQNQIYAEANAVSQNALNNPLLAPYKPESLYSPFNLEDSKVYTDANAQYNKLFPSGYIPTMYPQNNPEISQSQAQAEAIAKYTQAYAEASAQTFTDSNNLGNTLANSQVNSKYVPFSIYQPPASYKPYNSELYPNQIYPQPNAQNKGFIASPLNPEAAYDKYNSGITQNQGTNAHAASSVFAENQGTNAYADSSTFAENQGGNAYADSSAFAENQGTNAYAGASAIVENQGTNAYASSSALAQIADGYPSPANYYSGHLNPQLTAYPSTLSRILDGYKGKPLKYRDTHDTAQEDSLSVMNPKNVYYPLGAAYSPSIRSNNQYLSMYPKVISYDLKPLHHSGAFGSSRY